MIPVIYAQNTWVVAYDTIVTVNDQAYKIFKGFKTDLASIPRIFWSIFPPFGSYQDAAILHDYLLEYTNLPKKTIDVLFYKKMKEDNVNLLVRFFFYCVVNIVPKKKKPCTLTKS